jgi:hypothetical protein
VYLNCFNIVLFTLINFIGLVQPFSMFDPFWPFLAGTHPDMDIVSAVPLEECPTIHSCIHIYHPAIVRFYAPSDLCGVGGMHRERIRSNPNWQGKFTQYDTVFIETDSELEGMAGLAIGCALLLFSFKRGGKTYACALVH